MENTAGAKTTEDIETIDFWKQHLDSLKNSGLSRKQYCKQHSVNYDRFGYWIKRLTKSTEAKKSFIPVTIKSIHEELSPTVLCTLNLVNGTHLQIYSMQVVSQILNSTY